MLSSSPKKNRNRSLIQYASMGTQFLAGIGIGVFIGLKADAWLNLKFPLLVWILPLLIIVGFIVKLIKDTSKNNEQR
jgi:F0F1-type ATP synthase assembly protein I